MKWDFLIYCPNCGKKIAALNPVYDHSLTRQGFKPNGRVNFLWSCTACGARGFSNMFRPHHIEV